VSEIKTRPEKADFSFSDLFEAGDLEPISDASDKASINGADLTAVDRHIFVHYRWVKVF